MERSGLLRQAAALSMLLVLASGLSGCFGESPTPTPTPIPSPTPTPHAILIITSPEDGDVVRTPSVQVVGTAPPGAEIVLDISLFGDRRTSADDEGDWVLTVDLEEGPNDFAFRIGDDDSTTKALRVVYEPP
jgi:multidrug efflux pump subunit AcrA (membrane-fusion protein)